MRRGLAFLSLWLVAGCPGEVPPGHHDDGGGGDEDAGDVDGPPRIDAARPVNAAPIDAQACSNGAVMGLCLDLDVCAARGGTSTPGLCPGTPTNNQCCTGFTMSMNDCDPAAMPLPNQGLAEEPGEGGCPSGMVHISDLGGYCVDRFEGSLARVGGESWSPYFNPGGEAVLARSMRGAVPQAYIDAEQAEAACEEAGKRLCTDEEWLRACRGPNGWTYPYGDTRQPGVCNDARAVHPAIEYYGTSDPWVFTMLKNPCLNQLEDSLDASGMNAGCVTAEGAYDMMGNLHEWTADAAGTFRGGFYVDTVVNGDGCLYRTVAHDRSYWDYSTGFRCCSS